MAVVNRSLDWKGILADTLKGSANTVKGWGMSAANNPLMQVPAGMARAYEGSIATMGGLSNAQKTLAEYLAQELAGDQSVFDPSYGELWRENQDELQDFSGATKAREFADQYPGAVSDIADLLTPDSWDLIGGPGAKVAASLFMGKRGLRRFADLVDTPYTTGMDQPKALELRRIMDPQSGDIPSRLYHGTPALPEIRESGKIFASREFTGGLGPSSRRNSSFVESLDDAENVARWLQFRSGLFDAIKNPELLDPKATLQRELDRQLFSDSLMGGDTYLTAEALAEHLDRVGLFTRYGGDRRLMEEVHSLLGTYKRNADNQGLSDPLVMNLDPPKPVGSHGVLELDTSRLPDDVRAVGMNDAAGREWRISADLNLDQSHGVTGSYGVTDNQRIFNELSQLTEKQLRGREQTSGLFVDDIAQAIEGGLDYNTDILPAIRKGDLGRPGSPLTSSHQPLSAGGTYPKLTLPERRLKVVTADPRLKAFSNARDEDVLAMAESSDISALIRASRDQTWKQFEDGEISYLEFKDIEDAINSQVTLLDNSGIGNQVKYEHLMSFQKKITDPEKLARSRMEGKDPRLSQFKSKSPEAIMDVVDKVDADDLMDMVWDQLNHEVASGIVGQSEMDDIIQDLAGKLRKMRGEGWARQETFDALLDTFHGTDTGLITK